MTVARFRLRMLGLLALPLIACDSSAFDAAQVEGEAATFMEGYARDLIAHDVAAIADRYDRRGAYRMGHGQKNLSPFDSIRVSYRDAWQGPAAFEWHDLSFEAITGDAVLVAGRFSWTFADSVPPLSMSYSGLLLRQDGELRIRLEDESMDLFQVEMVLERMAAGSR